MNDDHEHLIVKFLGGNCSEKESAQLKAWVNKSIENEKMFNDLQQVWRTTESASATPDFQTDQEWSKFKTSIENAGHQSSGTFKLWPDWMKVAASVTFLVLSSLVVYQVFFNHQQVTKQTSDNTLHFTLPDGSAVWLNENSRLIYSENFNAIDRVVTFTGEGFFEIAKNTDRPFIVRLQNSQVKVLGTSFNVNAYSAASCTEVSVKTGLVSFSSLENQHRGILLKPGEKGILNKGADSVMLMPADNLNLLAWKEKRLMFKKTPLDSVIKTLNKYFKVTISVKNNTLLKCTFTSTFNNPRLEEVIEALKVSLDLTVLQDKDVIIMDGEGC
jgi:transmembrane sensor